MPLSVTCALSSLISSSRRPPAASDPSQSMSTSSLTRRDCSTVSAKGSQPLTCDGSRFKASVQEQVCAVGEIALDASYQWAAVRGLDKQPLLLASGSQATLSIFCNVLAPGSRHCAVRKRFQAGGCSTRRHRRRLSQNPTMRSTITFHESPASS